MENFDQIFTLLANEGITLNTDILETGLINILALLAFSRSSKAIKSSKSCYQ